MKEFRPTPIYKNHYSVDTSPYIHQKMKKTKGHLLGNKGPVPKNRDSFWSVFQSRKRAVHSTRARARSPCSLSFSLSLSLFLCKFLFLFKFLFLCLSLCRARLERAFLDRISEHTSARALTLLSFLVSLSLSLFSLSFFLQS